jgi:hypothetical protein
VAPRVRPQFDRDPQAQMRQDQRLAAARAELDQVSGNLR